MYDQMKDTVVTNLVSQLKAKGINIDPETVKKAIANFPHLVQEIQGILSASSSPERLAKIQTLISKAARGELTGSETEKSGTTK